MKCNLTPDDVRRVTPIGKDKDNRSQNHKHSPIKIQDYECLCGPLSPIKTCVASRAKLRSNQPPILTHTFHLHNLRTFPQLCASSHPIFSQSPVSYSASLPKVEQLITITHKERLGNYQLRNPKRKPDG